MDTHPPFDLDAVRARIPVLGSRIPMNACSQAPQSAAARAAAEAYLDSWDRDVMDWEAWMAEVEAARSAFARLIGGEPADVAVASSLSQATSSLASGLDYGGTRREVVVSGVEFPTVAHVWRAQERFGARVTTLPLAPDGTLPLDAYEAAVGPGTLLVSAAHAYYQTGWMQDVPALAERAHAAGALLFVDAYQSLGTGPFDAPASGADFVGSGNLKYLMGTPGIAFLWVRPGVAERLRPGITGWFGRRDPAAFDFALDWAEGARRLDVGTPPILPAYIARAGMEWLLEVGLERVGAWNRTLARYMRAGARARGLATMDPPDPDARTPTTAFPCADAHAVEARLRERGIIASARGPALRLAPHFYNTLDDVDAALDALAAELEDGAGAA
ncbi:MAG: aminotransferase class V-fold PLP-dependent enzyme [Longimicrobiales bacterium]|nr:aminotransferase class V-fold PLP-dependent enzyme [Longimicrobiales bacterium]